MELLIPKTGFPFTARENHQYKRCCNINLTIRHHCLNCAIFVQPFDAQISDATLYKKTSNTCMVGNFNLLTQMPELESLKTGRSTDHT
jgi:hypothetical protein